MSTESLEHVTVTWYNPDEVMPADGVQVVAIMHNLSVRRLHYTPDSPEAHRGLFDDGKQRTSVDYVLAWCKWNELKPEYLEPDDDRVVDSK